MNKITDLFLLKEILLQEIINNDSFDILDYYELTDIHYYDLIKILQNEVGLTLNERKILINFLNRKFGNKNYFSNKTDGFTKDLERFKNARYREYLSISGIDISLEMKEQAINYLLENNIPIDPKTYIAVLRRMVKQIKEETLIL